MADKTPAEKTPAPKSPTIADVIEARRPGILIPKRPVRMKLSIEAIETVDKIVEVLPLARQTLVDMALQDSEKFERVRKFAEELQKEREEK